MAEPFNFTEPEIAEIPRRWRWYLPSWFLAGFLVVFVPMLFTRGLYWHSPAQSLVECQLWDFYRLSIHSDIPTVAALGRSPRCLSDAVPEFGVHLIASVVGGFVSLITGLFFREVSDHPRRRTGHSR